MRSTLIAMVTAAGIGLLGTSASLAAPASGTVLRDLANANSAVEQVYCRYWRRCWHGYYSGRRCRLWRRCW